MSKYKNLVSAILLTILICIHLGYAAYVLASQKEGCFSDEIFSYGLSNSYYQPYLCVPGDALFDSIELSTDAGGNLRADAEKAGLIDCFQWISGEIYRNYLTVQPDQRFSYGSVIYNQSLDLHPPLYYLLLHTVCSFFPNSFSPWYAFSLNLVFMAGTMVLLFLTARKLSNSRAVSLLICLLYGFSSGALSTTLFLRQYCLLTFLTLAFTCFAVHLYYRRELTIRENRKYYICVILCAFAAFMTHFYAIIYVGFFTLFYCLILSVEKKFRKMFFFGFSMLAALLCFLALWPHIFSQTFSYQNALIPERLSPSVQTKMMLRILCRYCYGFSINVLHSAFWKIVLPPAAALFVLVPVLLLPFRDEAWCQALFAKAKAFPHKAKVFLQTADYLALIIAVSALAVYFLVGKFVDIASTGEFIIRYVMHTFPLLCMVSVLWISKLLRSVFSHSKKVQYIVLSALILLAIIRTHLITCPPFLFPNFGDSQDTAQLLNGKNVVWIYDDRQHAFLFGNWSVAHLRNTQNAFLVSSELLEAYLPDIRQLSEPVDYAIVYAPVLPLRENDLPVCQEILSEYQDYSAAFPSIMDSLNLPDIASAAGQDNFSPERGEDVTVQEAEAAAGSPSLIYPPLLQSLSAGGDYEVLYGFYTQGGLFYVVKLL